MQLLHDWPDATTIREKRRELGMTQQDLAMLSGVPQPVISRIEKGEIADPSYRAVRRIFEGLSKARAGSHWQNRPLQPSAGDLMNEPVISAKATDRVKDAWVLMRKYGFSQLPIIDDHGRLVGGIVESSALSQDEGVMEKRVSDVMRDIFPTVGRDTKMQTIVSMLKTEPALLVMDRGKVAGIVTAHDVMENAYKKHPSVLR